MTSQSTINQIITSQKASIIGRDSGLSRDALADLPDLSNYALIVSGIRRCGKSTLLFQLLKERYLGALYLNFEDPRLYDFEKKDFEKLDLLIKETGSKVLLFDEIQIVAEWERYTRQKLDEGFKVVITGSNASLLSRELGTKLTGRHITKELFPFSYTEFIRFKNLVPSSVSLKMYLDIGGFPEYVKQGASEILSHLFEDILIRDIAVRYGIRDIKVLQRLALYLISNVGKLISANRLKDLFEVGSTNTITEFLSHLEDSYLFQLVPKFSYSLRSQMRNARKVYAIDTGLISVNSDSFSEDMGRKLENIIYLHLRRRYTQIFYFSQKRECDFVVVEKGVIQDVLQVCYELNADNRDREIDGLVEALKFLKLKNGTIVTLDQEDKFEREGITIQVLRSFEYLS